MKLNVSFEERTKAFDPQLGESNQQFSAGFRGLQTIHGKDGEDGKSAYEIALDNGFVGTETEWLDSLHGKDGEDGKSAYELAVEDGFVGTEEEWLDSLHGKSVDFETDETLTLENGVLRVNTANKVGNSTLPITAAAVNATVGNIEVLLGTI